MNGLIEHYLGLAKVDYVTDESLMNELYNFLNEKGTDITKVMFISFDGYNTMSGTQRGVQRLFRHESVYSLYINCRNHKLALCFKHLMKSYEILRETDACLVSFAKLFEYSDLKDAILRNVQECKGEKVLEPIKPSVTRWLSHKDCCIRIFERYESYIDALDQIFAKTRDPHVLGVHTILLKPDIVTLIVILCDILTITSILQSNDVNFTKLTLYVQSTISALSEINESLDSGGEALHYFSKFD